KFDANMELAHLYSKLGDYEKARKCYIKVQTELNRKKTDLTENAYSQLESILLLNKGRSELDSQDYNSAIGSFQKIVTKGHENNDIVESNDYDKFKESLDRLSEVKNPNLGRGWWQWWFGESKNKDGVKRKSVLNKSVYLVSKYGRKIAGIMLLVIISALVIKL